MFFLFTSLTKNSLIRNRNDVLEWFKSIHLVRTNRSSHVEITYAICCKWDSLMYVILKYSECTQSAPWIAFDFFENKSSTRMFISTMLQCMCWIHIDIQEQIHDHPHRKRRFLFHRPRFALDAMPQPPAFSQFCSSSMCRISYSMFSALSWSAIGSPSSVSCLSDINLVSTSSALSFPIIVAPITCSVVC